MKVSLILQGTSAFSPHFFLTAWIFITRLIKVQVNLLPSKGKPSPRHSVPQDFLFSCGYHLYDQDTR